jgi:FkbM family methyltransferase
VELKAHLKSLIWLVARMLPPRISETLFQALLDRRGRYTTLFELAREYNIVSLKAHGDYGILQSAASDLVLLPVYAGTGQWAPRTNNLLKDFFAKSGGGTYIDIGANIGATTIPVAQDSRVRCLAIEPEPVNYSNLVANVAANCPYGNVDTLQVAAFCRRSTLELELAGAHIGDHRLRLIKEIGQLHEEERRTISVSAVPLDEIAPEREGPLGIKIDTQGARLCGNSVRLRCWRIPP